MLVAARLNLNAFRSGTKAVPAVLRALVRAPALRRAAADMGAADANTFAARLAGLSSAERTREVLHLVRAQVATILGHSSPELINPSLAFKELGFDSLTAVELRNRLVEATGRRLPAINCGSTSTEVAWFEDATMVIGWSQCGQLRVAVGSNGSRTPGCRRGAGRSAGSSATGRAGGFSPRRRARSSFRLLPRCRSASWRQAGEQ